jgi:K+-transporting ATPase ATPase C chain
MIKQLKSALVLFILLSLATGIVYPMAVTGVAQLLFPAQANGSIILKNGKLLGSALIGQGFSDPKYFWPRPSATSGHAYNAFDAVAQTGSTGSNLGPLSKALVDAVRARLAALHAADPAQTGLVPVDLVTASASGLDPHISVAAARYQIPRVARAERRSGQITGRSIHHRSAVRRPWRAEGECPALESGIG